MSLLEPGRNCWRIEHADRFRCVLSREDRVDAVAERRGPAVLEGLDHKDAAGP